MRTAFLILLVLIVVAGVTAFAFTGDGERVTPKGEGTVVLEAGAFETFPLPGYAAAYLTDQYKSYFVEVEPVSKFTLLKWGQAFR